jgi:hypothetical protein
MMTGFLMSRGRSAQPHHNHKGQYKSQKADSSLRVGMTTGEGIAEIENPGIL